MKKGQIEMIGLVIVVLLIVIGGLLYIKFGVLDKKETKKEAVIETVYAVNTLNAIKNVRICGDEQIKMQEAMNSCINGQEICEKEACDLIKSEIGVIMDSIGLTNQYTYSFYLEKKSEIVYIQKQCNYGTKADFKVGDISSGYYTVNLQIC